jgi:hypothetical protein
VPPAARIGHGDAAPLGQPRDQRLVDTALKAFVVGGVNQEFGTERFEEADGFLCVFLVFLREGWGERGFV